MNDNTVNFDGYELDDEGIPKEVMLNHEGKIGLPAPLLVQLAQGFYTYNIFVVVFPNNLTDRQKVKLLDKGYSPPLSLREASNYGQTCDELEYGVH